MHTGKMVCICACMHTPCQNWSASFVVYGVMDVRETPVHRCPFENDAKCSFVELVKCVVIMHRHASHLPEPFALWGRIFCLVDSSCMWACLSGSRCVDTAWWELNPTIYTIYPPADMLEALRLKRHRSAGAFLISTILLATSGIPCPTPVPLALPSAVPPAVPLAVPPCGSHPVWPAVPPL